MSDLDLFLEERVAAMTDDEFAALVVKTRPPADLKARAVAALRNLRVGIAYPDSVAAADESPCDNKKAAAAAAVRNRQQGSRR